LGPNAWHLNETAGPLGMVLFFNLSGFLITSSLLDWPDVRTFFIRRGCRILPLAVLFILLALTLQGRSLSAYLAYLLFYVNYQTAQSTPVTSPLWSLCVEVQFYTFVGLLVGMAGRRGLAVLPVVCLLVTGLRVWQGAHVSIATHLRVDEILAGATLALVCHHPRAAAIQAAVARLPLMALLAVLLLCCHPAMGPLNYLRPYVGAAVIGHTLWRPGRAAAMLASRPLRYLADISYALYVIHPIMRVGWLGSGGGWERYLLKRPLGFAITFALAHLSTFYYERHWIKWGKHLVAVRKPKLELPLDQAVSVASVR
jgi:peptidoglycan/LPS O-acetylase OafA/YrhL